MLLFFVACSPSGEIVAQKITGEITTDVETSEIEEFEEESLSCDKVICSNNFVCEDGKCICKGKICGTFCVIDGCCTEEDCNDNEQCINHECIKSKVCQFNQVFDEEQDKCVCKEDYFFCEEQNKCLNYGSCCHQGDCDRYSSCVDTVWAVSICFQYPDKKLCRTLRDFIPEEVIITPEGDLFVKLEGIFSGGVAKIKIEDEVYNLAIDERISAAKGTVWLEKITTFGGTCKVED